MRIKEGGYRMAQGFSIGIYTENVFASMHQQMKRDVEQSSSDEQAKQERITALDMRFQEIDEIVHSLSLIHI